MAQQHKPIIAQPVKAAKPVAPKVSNSTRPAYFVFDKGNYRLFFVAIALVIIGFICMTGTTDIYDTRKIVIAPLLVLSGFVVGFFAIFKKPEPKA
jgi:hypothetical protein